MADGQVAVADFDRDPGFEAQIVERVVMRYASTARAAGREMVALAHERAHDGPVVPNGRSFVAEAREELADACNYLVWHRRRCWAARAAPDELVAIDSAIGGLARAWAVVAAVPEVAS